MSNSGFNHDDHWGHRAGEPNKAVICSIALARLRTDIKGNDLNSNAVGMAQKLLLFWRKPARRCWWEGVELENVEGVEGKLKVWIRRVWTLEMVSQCLVGLRTLLRLFRSATCAQVVSGARSKGAANQTFLANHSCLQSVIGLR